jgi:hypothetical protein
MNLKIYDTISIHENAIATLFKVLPRPCQRLASVPSHSKVNQLNISITSGLKPYNEFHLTVRHPAVEGKAFNEI